MWKFAKYLWLFRWYAQHKKQLFFLGVGVALMFGGATLFNELIAIAPQSQKYVYVTQKWLFLLALGVGMFFVLRKRAVLVNEKKEALLHKKKLQSRADLIVEKYKSKQ